jgi:hypothetical protein
LKKKALHGVNNKWIIAAKTKKNKKENQGKELQVTANFVGTGKECLLNADIPSTSLADFSIFCKLNKPIYRIMTKINDSKPCS